MKAPTGRGAGLTLVEVTVAVAVLAIGLLAWAGVQARLARVERSDQVRRELAASMRNELQVQRSVRAFGCRSRVAPGWGCSVLRSCLDGVGACEAEAVRVTITPPGGGPWTGVTAVWWPLQRAPVERSP